MSGVEWCACRRLSNPADSYTQERSRLPRLPQGDSSTGEARPAGRRGSLPASPPPRSPAGRKGRATAERPRAPHRRSRRRTSCAEEEPHRHLQGKPHVGRAGGAGTIKIGVSVSRECALRLPRSPPRSTLVDARNRWVRAGASCKPSTARRAGAARATSSPASEVPDRAERGG